MSLHKKSVFDSGTTWSRAHKNSSNGINDLLSQVGNGDLIEHLPQMVAAEYGMTIVKRPFDYCNEKECINLVIDVKVSPAYIKRIKKSH